MAERIVADLRVLEEAETSFGKVLEAIRDSLADLDRSVTGSLSDWDGPAKEAYLAAQAQWEAAADEMADRLAWLQQVIARARGNHGRALGTNVAMWTV